MEFTWKKILLVCGFFIVLIVGPLWVLSSPMIESYVKRFDREPEKEESKKYLLKCADICYSTMREDMAAKYYQKFYDRYTEDYRRPYALYWLAMSLDKLNKNKDAIDTFHKYINEYPDGQYTKDATDGVHRVKYTKPNN